MFLLDSFCQTSREMWQIVGKVLFIFKIVIPLLIIVFGMIDLGKAVISSEEKEIKNATTSIMRRLIAAIVIFFVPTIVDAIFNMINDFDSDKNQAGYNICEKCLTKPYSNDCSGTTDTAKK